jgi:hypothetical protein
MTTWRLSVGLLCLALAGCGTTRVTDTQRTATEQLLVSNAVDQAISQLDCRCLAGKPVYFDPQYLDGSLDRGYLVSSIRQHLLACGCILQEDRTKSVYVIEARSGGIGTDRNALLIGVPQMNVPTLVPGQPSSIPEIPIAKKTDQKGVAKVAVFAYNRITGKPVWQSGVVQATSTAKDTWFLGVGPIMRGTIRENMEFAGAPLGFPLMGDDDHELLPVVAVDHPANWNEPGPLKSPGPSPLQLLAANGKPTELVRPEELAPTTSLLPPPAPASSPPPPAPSPSPPPPTPNAGGQAETEPARLQVSGFGVRPDS